MIRLPRLLSRAALAGAAFAFTASLPSLSSLHAQATDPQAPDAGAAMTDQGAGGATGARGRTGRNAAPTRRNQGTGTGAAAPGRGTTGRRNAAGQRGAAAPVVPAKPAPADAGADTPADAAAGTDAAPPDDAASKAPPRRAGKIEGDMPDATPAAAQDAAAPEPAPEPAATEPAPGADGAATQPGAETQPAESSLAETVDNFWHYAQIARYDLAAAAGNRILNSGAQPSEILAAFEQVAQRRGATRKAAGGTQETLDAALVRWQGIEPIRDVATKLTQTLNQGYTEKVLNQEFIQQQIERLGDNGRAYNNGVQRLRQSGQYAVPMMLRYLRDPAKQELHSPIRRALQDLGRAALSPLVAATATRDNNLLIPVVTVLGDIGYKETVLPYLVRVGTDPNVPDSVRSAVDKSLQKLGVNASSDNPADLFAKLGEEFYYDTGAIKADPRSPTTPVWVWDEQTGLSMKPVSSPIFNEVMAMLAAEEALKVGGGQADAASLWLAANNKREAEMPAENPVDEVNAGRPPAHFYNVAMGVQRLNNVLARALRDRNAAVALKAVRSLQGVAGQSTLFANAGGAEPLVEAMRFPDRTVRYESAMAIASSLPQQQFNGQEMVVPLLAEAVSQSGRPNVLLVVGSEAERSRLAGELKQYATAGGIGANGALADARSLPSVDVILIAADVPNDQIYEVIRIARESPRLDRTAKVILRNEGGATWRREAINDPTLSVSQATEAAAVAAAIEEGRSKTGGLPMDQNVANEFALRAANLLSRLAISRGQVLDLSPALPTLLGALSDPRPEIVHAVGDTLALVPSPQVQPALLDRAQDANNAPEVRSGLYRSLATSAKFFGSQLGGQQIAALRQTVAGDQNQDVRSAAAESLGALNAPVQNVAQLITEHGAAPGGQAPAAPPESQPAAPVEQQAGAEPAAVRTPAAAPRAAVPRAGAPHAGRPVSAQR